MNYFPIVQKKKYKAVITDLSTQLVPPPFTTAIGCSVEWNKEIHTLVGTNHYKWDGSEWSNVGTLPFSVRKEYCGAVVFNGEIHLLGGTSDLANMHYKWDGNAWTSVSTLPNNFNYAKIVVFNNEIHILYGENTSHYKWDGNAWTSVSTLPIDCRGSAVCVFNNEIHIVGENSMSSYYPRHYKWDGNTWTFVARLPDYIYENNCPYAVPTNNAIYFYYDDLRSVFNGTNWVQLKTRYPKNGGGWQYASNSFENNIRGSSVVFVKEPTLLSGVHIINYTETYPYGIARHAVENIRLFVPIDGQCQ